MHSVALKSSQCFAGGARLPLNCYHVRVVNEVAGCSKRREQGPVNESVSS